MNIKDFIADYRYKTEFHAHTYPVSKCADIIAADTVRIYAEKGVDSMVITNHINGAIKSADYYLSDYYKAAEAGAKYGVNVILGVEICFIGSRNDYLVYGVEESEIAKMISLVPKGIETFYKEIKNDRNVILQAHPFRKGLTRAPIDCIDGIESFNLHPGHNSVLGFAARYVRENGFYATCGSDFHHITHEAVCLVRSNKEMKDSFDIADLIKSKDYLFDLSGHIVFPYADI